MYCFKKRILKADIKKIVNFFLTFLLFNRRLYILKNPYNTK